MRPPEPEPRVEGEIERENIHPRLTDEAERAASRVRLDERADVSRRQPAHPRNALHLKFGVSRGDVWVETACTCGHRIERQRSVRAESILGAIYRGLRGDSGIR